MCGRFTFNIPPELLFELFGLPDLPALVPRYNIAPTQLVPVIRQHPDGQYHLDHLRWGLIPSWAKDPSVGSRMINARSETVLDKPAFRQAIRYRRCLVLASGFYEWEQKAKTKQPWFIALKGEAPMACAGIWESWKGTDGAVIETCSILTTVANGIIEPLHDRMPVILSPDEYETWLDRELTNPARLQRLYHPFPVDLMETWPVSMQVNKVANDSPELVVAVEAPKEVSLFTAATENEGAPR